MNVVFSGRCQGGRRVRNEEKNGVTEYTHVNNVQYVGGKAKRKPCPWA
jgi:hypothetical protein